jgi:hypothetical protein
MRFYQTIFRRHVKQSLITLLICASAASSVHAQDAEIGEAAPLPRGVLSDAILTEHNSERAAIGLSPLAWDNLLAADAARWAEKLAVEKRFDHAVDELPIKKQGENLWMGTADAYSYAEMIAFWLDESKMTKAGVFPDVSTTGNWIEVGHYTQMIWPATQQVGCAIARNTDDEFLVCRYAPAGNRIGDRLQVKSSK